MEIDREKIIGELRERLRPGQRYLADWRGGRMAISAVPGAGKSHSLATAATIAIARHGLNAKKQLLIVTYTRSAAAGIKGKIDRLLRELKLPPNGFSVQTIHGLALQIAGRDAGLSGIDTGFDSIVNLYPGHPIIRNCVEEWIVRNREIYGRLLEGVGIEGEEIEIARRQSVLKTEILPGLACSAIHEAKSSGLSVERMGELGRYANDGYGILTIAAGLYDRYEKATRARNFIDYDEMILGALRVLENKTRLEGWRSRVFGVFEDEAQDSSPLQEKLLSLLADDGKGNVNLIRVGDPNQAINSTFTPADPVYFNWFCESCRRNGNLATMARAGRSNKIIIAAANRVLEWVEKDWRRGKPGDVAVPFRVQEILPTDAGDPQGNPEPVGKGLEVYLPADIYASVTLIEKRVIALLSGNKEHNGAVLVRENRQGSFLAKKLAHLPKQYGIKVFEANESDRFSKIPEDMSRLLQFVERPHSPDNLKKALEVLQERELIPVRDLNALSAYPEQFLYPGPLDAPRPPGDESAGRYCRALLKAKLELPDYHLFSFFAMTLGYRGSELATLEKLASRVYMDTAGNRSLKSTIAALEAIIVSERFEGVDEEDDDRYTRKGQLTIITMHKAKGLDWDYVFIPFLHDDLIPGDLRVPAAAKFLGDFTVSEVARAWIRSTVHNDYLNPGTAPPILQPLEAWEEAKQLKKAEEYRLLYVAMTRAKRLLWMAAEKRAPFRWGVFQGEENSKLVDKKPCPVIPVLIDAFPDAVMEG